MYVLFDPGLFTNDQLIVIRKSKSLNEALSQFGTRQLCTLFDYTDNLRDDNIPAIRGVIMDILEARDPEKFNEWIDNGDYIAALEFFN